MFEKIIGILLVVFINPLSTYDHEAQLLAEIDASDKIDEIVNYDSDDECRLADQNFIFFKNLIEKYVEPKYQQIGCLIAILFGNVSGCDFKRFALPVNTRWCNRSREAFQPNGRDERHVHGANMRAFYTSIDTFFASRDIDVEDVCQQVYEFNQIPPSEITKQMYADFYNSTAKLMPEVYYELASGTGGLHFYSFTTCVRDLDAIAREFFGNLPPIGWEPFG